MEGYSTTGPVTASWAAPSILQLTLNRPANRNAITAGMLTALVSSLDRASRDSAVRAVVVTGNPEGKAFSAGADLSSENNPFEGAKKDAPKQARQDYRDGGGYTTLAALRCTKPVIAAINGPAVGWGLAFTLGCDIRVAAAEAKVGFPMAARGLVNESISSYLLPRIVGPGFAKELVFTSRIFRAKDAPPGLFNHVVPAGDVLQTAVRIGQEIATNSSGMSVAMCKSLMDEGLEAGSPEQAMLNESACMHWVNASKTGDVREGIGAFLQKRRPQWVHDAWDDLPDFLPFRQPLDVRPGRPDTFTPSKL